MSGLTDFDFNIKISTSECQAKHNENKSAFYVKSGHFVLKLKDETQIVNCSGIKLLIMHFVASLLTFLV